MAGIEIQKYALKHPASNIYRTNTDIESNNIFIIIEK